MISIKTFVVNFVEENCYILWDDTREAVIVDCGTYKEEEKEEIRRCIEENRLKPRHLLNTHGHFDHIFGNDFICKTYGLHPQMSREEAETYSLAALHMRQFIRRELPLEIPAIGNYLQEGDEIPFGTHSLKVISTPGHTPGGICFYLEEEKILLSGDSLFLHCIGRCDLPGGNEVSLVRSLREKILTLPPETKVLPGHGPQTTVGEERIGNPYL